MHDHRENIYEASRSYTERTFAPEDPDEYGEYGILDVAHFTCRTSDAYRTEFVLAVGGPTVYVTVDSRWSDVTFHHSWGADPRTGTPSTHISMHPADGELWQALAESYAEVHA